MYVLKLKDEFKEKIPKEYLHFILSSEYVKKQIDQLSTGSILESIGEDLVKEIKVIIYNDEEIKKITQTIKKNLEEGKIITEGFQELKYPEIEDVDFITIKK